MALLSIAGLYWILPESLTPGPSWLLALVVVPLSAVSLLLHRQAKHTYVTGLGYALSGIVTLALIGSLGLLIAALPGRQEPPRQLLWSAAALWTANILVFAGWYWRLDAGGPHARESRPEHTEGAFLFPQMTMNEPLRAEQGWQTWRPGFMDYLFLAFNTSTAFSPTDVPVLSRWAKAMMMVQALISLATVALLAARAVNIL
jgi:hypothetical protein